VSPPDTLATDAPAPAPDARADVFERVGRLIADGLALVGAISVFGARALIEIWRPPYELRELFRQIYELGFRSVPLIATSGLAVGVVLSMHTRASLERFGAEALIPAGLAIALVRETGPLVTGLLLSGRIGAGIGAEIAAMKVTEQIDALEATAVDSFKYLVVTRVVACMLSVPLLVTVMNFTGMLGGYLAEKVITGMSLRLYFDAAFSSVQFTDYIPATLKTIVFGFIIAVVSSYLGFTTTQGTEGVGRASTRSVVFSSILIITANVVLVRLIFFFFPEAAGL
jgi:phospholipid/cholesterol/gamma-HCH transport system permease protein